MIKRNITQLASGALTDTPVLLKGIIEFAAHEKHCAGEIRSEEKRGLEGRDVC
jgi:hypothetical protein